MSYDISLVDSTDEVIILDEPWDGQGGTYQVGGTHEAWLNVTYNYGEILRDVLGPGGIRSLYGKRAIDTIPKLEAAIDNLGDDVSGDYWEATEGNVKRALMDLVRLAKLAPHGVWKGD